MKTFTTILASAALMAANSATAQSSTSSPAGSFSTDGYFISGYVDLTYTDNENGNETFARADLDMGILPAAGISSFPIGFSLGIDGFALGDENEIALYPAVTFALGDDLISAGIPRSVMDKGYIPHYDFAGSSTFDLELKRQPFWGSILVSSYLQGGQTPFGIRYDSKFGDTKVGASYHRVTEMGIHADFYALAFQHQLSAISSFYELMFFGGIEHVRLGSIADVTDYQLGIEGGTDKLHAGILLERSNVIATSETANLYVDYKINDAFSLNASVARFRLLGSPTVNFYGVGLEYNFFNNGYLRANYVKPDIAIASDVFELTVGWKF